MCDALVMDSKRLQVDLQTKQAKGRFPPATGVGDGRQR
jgi:hypothetical protein